MASGGQTLEPSWVRGPRNAVRRDLCEWPQALPLSDPHAACGDPGTHPSCARQGPVESLVQPEGRVPLTLCPACGDGSGARSQRRGPQSLHGRPQTTSWRPSAGAQPLGLAGGWCSMQGRGLLRRLGWTPAGERSVWGGRAPGPASAEPGRGDGALGSLPGRWRPPALCRTGQSTQDTGESPCLPALQSGPPCNLLLECLGKRDQPQSFCKDDTGRFKK